MLINVATDQQQGPSEPRRLVLTVNINDDVDMYILVVGWGSPGGVGGGEGR